MAIANIRIDTMKGTSLIWIFILLTLPVSNFMADDTSPSLEYQIKAGFTCKFVKFVKWPMEVFPEKGTPFTIGILGKDPFGSVMDEAIKDLTIKKRKFAVKRYNDVNGLEFCHILFIARSERERLDKIITQLHESPTLTVSEMDGFCQQGGMINYVIKYNKVRFEVNVEAAREAGLEISTQFLRLADIVESNQVR